MALSRGSKGFLLALLLLALAVGGGLLALQQLDGGGDEGGDPVTVEIPEGAGTAEIAELLSDAEVVTSSMAFQLSARLDERGGRIQPGTYELRTGMGTDEALEILSAPPRGPEPFRVTIPEGLTVEQTLSRIADAGPYDVDELRTALDGVALPDWVPDEFPDDADPFEGLLFPNTYEFTVETPAAEVLGRLVWETEEVLNGVHPPDGLDRYEVLVMGSLIEREARLAEEQRRIAAVMHNRLEQNMRLQIDATVIYAHGEHLERVTHDHLEIDSPWNTYAVHGLPPTPISGAGRGAIEAAANPTDEDYLYYVVIDPETGEHGFSRTLEEHNELRRESRGE